jgi:hypothetical protein
MSWPVALMWGTFIVAVVLAVLAAAYFSFGRMMKLTHKFAELTPDKRPQDPHMDGTGLL